MKRSDFTRTSAVTQAAKRHCLRPAVLLLDDPETIGAARDAAHDPAAVVIAGGASSVYQLRACTGSPERETFVLRNGRKRTFNSETMTAAMTGVTTNNVNADW